MPTDVSLEAVSHAAETQPVRKLPVGIGLTIGAGVSIALWTCIGLGLHALFG